MGDFSDQVKALKESLEAKSEATRANVNQAVKNATLRIEREVKVSMRNTQTVEPGSLTRGGRLMGHPTTSAKGKASWHLPSAPGFAPNPDTGALMASYTHEYQNDGNTGIIGSKLEYAKWLEFGTSKMAARPALGPAVQKVAPMFKDDLKFSMAQPQIEAESD